MVDNKSPYEAALEAAGYRIQQYSYTGRAYFACSVHMKDDSGRSAEVHVEDTGLAPMTGDIWGRKERVGESAPGDVVLKPLYTGLNVWLVDRAAYEPRRGRGATTPRDVVVELGALWEQIEPYRQAAWDEREKVRAQGRELANGVAAAMGPGWLGTLEVPGSYDGYQATKGYHFVYLRNGDAVVSFGWLGEGARPYGRYEIFGEFHDGLGDYRAYNAGSCSIGVSASKTPEQIGREISRRLLPNYLGQLRKARMNKADYEATLDGSTKLAERLIAASGGALRYAYSDEGNKAKATERRLRGIDSDVDVRSDSVTFKNLRCTPEIAEALVVLLTAQKVGDTLKEGA